MDTHGVVPKDARVRYRPSLGQQVPFLVLALLFVANVVLMSLTTHDWIPDPLFALLLLELIYLGRSVGVTLTPDEAIVHTFRRRRIPWRDVQCVQVERFMGSRVIIIYDARGRHFRLRAPMSGFLSRDKRFEEKFQTIGQWWLAHRGDDWTPTTAPTGWEWRRWDSGAAWAGRSRIRPSLAQRGPILLLLACLLMEVVVGAFGAQPGGHPTVVGDVVGVLMIAAIATGIWHFGLHAGVSFTTESLKAHNPRPRAIPWSEIDSMSVERTWHGTRLVVHETSGRRTRLSGPRVGLLLTDQDFAGKARAVHARRQEAVGADHVTALDFTAVRKPAVWKQVIVILACVVFCYELLIGTLVTTLLLAS